jgi:hypothetical protein
LAAILRGEPWALGFGQTVEDLLAKNDGVQWYNETIWHHQKLRGESSTQKDGMRCWWGSMIPFRIPQVSSGIVKIWCPRSKHKFDVVWKMLPPELMALNDLPVDHRLIKPLLKWNLFKICSTLRWIDDPLKNMNRWSIRID